MLNPVFVWDQGEVAAWELESSLLTQRTLRLPAPLLQAPFTALACHHSGSLFVGDEQGAVWRLQVWQNPPKSVALPPRRESANDACKAVLLGRLDL